MAQYHANLEIEFAGNQIGQSFSDSIKDAFNSGDTYSHEIFQTVDGKYHLSYLGNGNSDGNRIKKACVNLAKSPEIVAFSLKGDHLRSLSVTGFSKTFETCLVSKHFSTP